MKSALQKIPLKLLIRQPVMFDANIFVVGIENRSFDSNCSFENMYKVYLKPLFECFQQIIIHEMVYNDLEHLETSQDADAKTGHKTADTSFFGYKTHIAMSEERIITAATVTSGEKTDGKELPELVRKSREAGMEVEMVIGDKAYSEQKNIEEAQEGGYELISRRNGIITQGNRTKEDEFEFNKDAGMYQCKAGHLAVHKYLDRREKEKKNKNPRMTYFFDVEKCKCCPYRDGCYKEGAKKKAYSETLKSDAHRKQAEFQETEYFKEKMKERHKIEAKNSE